MTKSIDERLAAAGIDLPTPGTPLANYVPTVLAGNLLHISGQLPLDGGKIVETGALRSDSDIERGQRAARFCAINILAQTKAALGRFDRIDRLVKIGVFVSSASHFTSQHLVANGASDFLVEILGEDVGKHARAAVGMAALPMDASVEIEAIFAVKNA